MAQDLVDRKRSLVGRLMSSLVRMLDALNDAAEVAAIANMESISFVDDDVQEAVDATNGLRHLTATIVQDVIDQLDYATTGRLLNYMLVNGQALKFNKMRPG